MATQGDILARLQGCLADLDGYITRRAEDMAAPMIRDAEARARLAIVEARGEVQRERDLVAELRKRLHVLQRRTEEAEAARKRLAALLGHQEPSAIPLDALVAEVEKGQL